MREKPKNFELPKKIDQFLGILSRHYAQAGKRQLQELIVNARARINAEDRPMITGMVALMGMYFTSSFRSPSIHTQ